VPDRRPHRAAFLGLVALLAVVFGGPAAAAAGGDTLIGIVRSRIRTPVDFAGAPEVVWLLETPQGKFTLDFTEPPTEDLTGREVTAHGLVQDQRIAVTDYAVKPRKQLPLEGGPEPASHQTGTQNTIAILNKFADIAAEPQPSSFFSSLLFGAFPSLKTFWEENSYNAMTLGGSINGWWSLPQPQATYNAIPNFDARLNQLVADALTTAAANGMTDIPNGTRLLLFFNERFGCSCAVGTLGFENWNTPWGVRTFSVAWFPGGNLATWAWAVDVVGHEMGHNLGWWHSGNVYFTYDSNFDVVSRGCKAEGSHTIVFNKVEAGWLSGPSAFALPFGTTSTYTVFPTTRTSGLRGLTLDMGDGLRAYSIEVRLHEGHDACIPEEGVLIHCWHKDLEDWAKKPVDATPGDGTLTNALWLPGMTFSEPAYGLTVQVWRQNPNGSFDIVVFWPLPAGVGCFGVPSSVAIQVPLGTPVSMVARQFTALLPPTPTAALMPAPLPCN